MDYPFILMLALLLPIFFTAGFLVGSRKIKIKSFQTFSTEQKTSQSFTDETAFEIRYLEKFKARYGFKSPENAVDLAHHLLWELSRGMEFYMKDEQNPSPHAMSQASIDRKIQLEVLGKAIMYIRRSRLLSTPHSPYNPVFSKENGQCSYLYGDSSIAYIVEQIEGLTDWQIGRAGIRLMGGQENLTGALQWEKETRWPHDPILPTFESTHKG